MFERIEILDWVLDIDTEATRMEAERLPVVWPSACTCLHCKNFVSAADALPIEFVRLCSTLGVNPLKPIEVYEMGERQEGTHFYGGWYHMVGRIVSGPNSEFLAGLPYHVLSDRFEVRFTEDAQLALKHFTRPVLQLNFNADIPWVLDEKLDV